jgi:hypothetical protein
VRAVGTRLAGMIDTQSSKVDIAMVHDPLSAEDLAGHVPIVLAGHTHDRAVRRIDPPPGAPTPPEGQDRTLLMVQGSTGGAGLRGLESGTPLPLAMSVLYFAQSEGSDRPTLQAYDDIHVGGTGLAQVLLERKVAPFKDGTPAPATASPVPSPS